MAKVTRAERRTNLTDATPARNQRLTNVVLWSIAVVYVVGTMFTRILSVPVSLVPLLFPFALIHGAKRYAWNGIVVFVVFTFIISNILEKHMESYLNPTTKMERSPASPKTISK